jgi:hypothetical protein
MWALFLSFTCILNTVVPGYNDIGLCDSSTIALDNLYYQLILTVNVTLYSLVRKTLVYSNTEYSAPFMIL